MVCMRERQTHQAITPSGYTLAQFPLFAVHSPFLCIHACHIMTFDIIAMKSMTKVSFLVLLNIRNCHIPRNFAIIELSAHWNQPSVSYTHTRICIHTRAHIHIYVGSFSRNYNSHATIDSVL